MKPKVNVTLDKYLLLSNPEGSDESDSPQHSLLIGNVKVYLDADTRLKSVTTCLVQIRSVMKNNQEISRSENVLITKSLFGYLLDEDKKPILFETGEHSFPFDMNIPTNIPPSTYSDSLFIFYRVRASVKRASFKRTISSSVPINVISYNSINASLNHGPSKLTSPIIKPRASTISCFYNKNSNSFENCLSTIEFEFEFPNLTLLRIKANKFFDKYQKKMVIDLNAMSFSPSSLTIDLILQEHYKIPEDVPTSNPKSVFTPNKVLFKSSITISDKFNLRPQPFNHGHKSLDIVRNQDACSEDFCPSGKFMYSTLSHLPTIPESPTLKVENKSMTHLHTSNSVHGTSDSSKPLFGSKAICPKCFNSKSSNDIDCLHMPWETDENSHFISTQVPLRVPHVVHHSALYDTDQTVSHSLIVSVNLLTIDDLKPKEYSKTMTKTIYIKVPSVRKPTKTDSLKTVYSSTISTPTLVLNRQLSRRRRSQPRSLLSVSSSDASNSLKQKDSQSDCNQPDSPHYSLRISGDTCKSSFTPRKDIEYSQIYSLVNEVSPTNAIALPVLVRSSSVDKSIHFSPSKRFKPPSVEARKVFKKVSYSSYSTELIENNIKRAQAVSFCEKSVEKESLVPNSPNPPFKKPPIKLELTKSRLFRVRDQIKSHRPLVSQTIGSGIYNSESLTENHPQKQKSFLVGPSSAVLNLKANIHIINKSISRNREYTRSARISRCRPFSQNIPASKFQKPTNFYNLKSKTTDFTAIKRSSCNIHPKALQDDQPTFKPSSCEKTETRIKSLKVKKDSDQNNNNHHGFRKLNTDHPWPQRFDPDKTCTETTIQECPGEYLTLKELFSSSPNLNLEFDISNNNYSSTSTSGISKKTSNMSLMTAINLPQSKPKHEHSKFHKLIPGSKNRQQYPVEFKYSCRLTTIFPDTQDSITEEGYVLLSINM
ncbi:hypothetical protein AYI68_g8200 [Smittium mucronatum]|uniref:Arrestin-like N-terminal domain-containing protein n=1 Tax=Smittium mucronatum TaxID=133383 RepID=A0A1R0GLK9_9FUNG|nr:hypothetical protein AYI68_g8200 [Smittium mucronatum]